MSEIKITREMESIQTTALNVFESAKQVIIKDQESYDFQGNRLREIKTKWSQIEEKRKELIKPSQLAVKQLNDFFGGPLNNLKSAENLIKQALKKYIDEKKKERFLEERRLREQAEKEAAKLEKKADKQEAKGNIEKAKETRLDAMAIPVPVVASKIEKVKGVSFKEIWKFEIIDEIKLPRKYLLPDLKTLGELARSSKGKISIPGVRFYSDKTVAGARV